jgi:hypothetical protein
MPVAKGTKMEKQKITIKRPDEEHIEVYVGRKCVGNANHDEHGWAGMSATKSLVTSLAKALGIEVVDEG